ncbi:hypothetical protein BDQ17DRAFT_1181665, partial [Cyathus striatus]
WSYQPIMDTQIHWAILKINPIKATCYGSIPNSIIKWCRTALVPFLGPLFQGTFSLQYYPEEWACTETIVL